MANCLVTKLQTVVDNDHLEKLGIITFNVKSASAGRSLYSVKFNKLGSTIKVSGGLSIVGGTGITVASDGKSATNTNLDTQINLNESGGVITFNKYDLIGLYFSDSIFEDTELYTAQTSAIRSFYGGAWAGNVSDLPLIAKSLSSNNGKVYGNLESLSEHTQMEELTATPVTAFTRAQITALGKLVLLTRFSGPVYGSLESLVAAQRANGRTTGSIRLDYINMGMADTPFVTFNGSAAPTGDNKTLSWDATTITYDGVTITA